MRRPAQDLLSVTTPVACRFRLGRVAVAAAVMLFVVVLNVGGPSWRRGPLDVQLRGPGKAARPVRRTMRCPPPGFGDDEARRMPRRCAGHRLIHMAARGDARERAIERAELARPRGCSGRRGAMPTRSRAAMAFATWKRRDEVRAGRTHDLDRAGADRAARRRCVLARSRSCSTARGAEWKSSDRRAGASPLVMAVPSRPGSWTPNRSARDRHGLAGGDAERDPWRIKSVS